MLYMYTYSPGNFRKQAEVHVKGEVRVPGGGIGETVGDAGE
jgi:hypothetical protein